MKNKHYKKLILVLLISLQSCTSTAKENYQCPEKISANTTIQSIPDEWSVDDDGNKDHYLVGLTFTDGNPSDDFFLKPTESIDSSKPDSVVSVYDFSHNEGRHAWLVCMYGNTPVTLVKKLELPYSKCKVSNDLEPTDATVVCEK